MKASLKRNLNVLTAFSMAVFLSGVLVSSALAAGELKVTDGFAHYKFNSVNASLSSPTSQTVSGTTLHVTADLKNSNDYPIVDGSLYIKIYKKQIPTLDTGKDYFKELPDETLTNNGDFLIDQFIAKGDITLDKKEGKQITFDWKVPAYLSSGEYKLASFFQSANKFNLLGLSFTDDVLGNTLTVNIKNAEAKGIVEFDKNKVKMNGEPHNFVGFLKAFP